MQDSVSVAQLGASRSDQLARVMEAGLIAEGRVFALSLKSVRDQLGGRWAAKKDLVWETVERALVKRMPAPDLFLPIDDTTILAAIASTDAYDGQMQCADVLRSVLAFFLGRAAEGDLGIARVSGLNDGALTCEPVDLSAPRPPRRGRAGATAKPAPRSPEGWNPPLSGRRFSTPFLSERQGMVAMSLEVAPVWRLDQGVISAYALRRRLPVRLNSLTDADREQVDQHTADHLAPILEEYRREGGVFALIVPGFFSVASAKRSRLDLLHRCAGVHDIMRQVVVMQLEGLGCGAPLGQISATAAMMKPFFRSLTVTVKDAAEANAASREPAFNGMAIDAGAVAPSRLEGLVRAARRRTPNVMVHDILDPAEEERLHACGASHVSYRQQARPLGAVRPGGSAPVRSGPAAHPAMG